MLSTAGADDGLLLLLIAHILGDFYVQPDEMAERKGTDRGSLLRHGLIYAVCMVSVLLGCTDGGWRLMLIAVLGAALHWGIDALKPRAARVGFVARHLFTLDQLAHMLLLLLLWMRLGADVTVRPFLGATLGALPVRPLPLLLALLLVLRPVGLLIESGEIWDLGISEAVKNDHKPESSGGDAARKNREKKRHSGRMIGYLERLIILFLLINAQYSAIAFVLTAKSVARFKDLEKQINAEYYLIGTLLSVVSVFAVVMVLGLGG